MTIIFKKNFFSETAWPINAKFHVAPPWEGGTKVYINGLGHMTTMASKPIYANLNCIHFVMFKIVFHACYRRSKAFDSLCLFLYTVLPSLNKISYLILSYGKNL